MKEKALAAECARLRSEVASLRADLDIANVSRFRTMRKQEQEHEATRAELRKVQDDFRKYMDGTAEITRKARELANLSWSI